ncbi:MAG: type II secretion system F family protein [Phycisphaerae bacterium]|nr:type II secretion system F family protein [Phycisphaerae bacterium]
MLRHDEILAQVSQVLALSDQAWMYAVPLVGSVFLAFAIFNLIGDLRKTESKKIAQRLRGDFGSLSSSASERAAKESILRKQRRESGGLGALISRFGFVSSLQKMLDEANVPWSATTLLVNLTGLGALLYIGAYVASAAQWVCICAATSALLLPLLLIFVKRKMRLNKFMNQLPDVFELMSQGLRAGHSLASAIMLISQQLPDPVATEFARVFHEQNLGIKIEDALKNMAKRVGLMDVRFFVTAVLIQRQTGGDLAEVLDNISGVIRERIKLFGTVKALTAEGRLSGWVLLALPVVVFVMELWVNPDYANVLLEEELGQYMLIGAGVAQLLGLAMIQKIVNIKV